MRDLLYGALLPSGADCCEGLAEAAGGEEVLLEEMNRIADRLGMENSRFENLTGLDAAGHRSSAADLALLLQAALKNETFRSVLTSWSYLCTDASAHPDGITFESTLLRHQDQLRGAGWEVLGRQDRVHRRGGALSRDAGRGAGGGVSAGHPRRAGGERLRDRPHRGRGAGLVPSG